MPEEHESHDQAQPQPETGKPKEGDFAITRDKLYESTVHYLLDRFQLARDPGGTLYYFDGKCYAKDAENLLRDAATDYIEAIAARKRLWSPQLIDRIIARCHRKLPLLEEEPSANRINLANGVYDLNTGKLSPHDPEWRTTITIPVEYDPEAKSPEWDEFLSAAFPPDSLEIAYEILGSLLIPLPFLQVVIWIKGSGQNGKSVFLNAVSGFLGASNVAHISMESLNSERFAASRIYGKLAAIDPDVECRIWSETSVFKKASGGDPIAADRKNRDPIEFTYRGKFLLGGNEFPIARDKTFGFMRRWKILPFDQAFDLMGEAGKRKDPQELLDGLLSPRALSGALNRALVGLRRVLVQKRFSSTLAIDDATLEFQQTTDPLFQFFAPLLEVWTDGQFIIHKDLFSDLTDWLTERKLRLRSTQDFAVWIRRNMKEVMEWKAYTDDLGDDDRRRTVRGWVVNPSKHKELERLTAVGEAIEGRE